MEASGAGSLRRREAAPSNGRRRSARVPAWSGSASRHRRGSRIGRRRGEIGLPRRLASSAASAMLGLGPSRRRLARSALVRGRRRPVFPPLRRGTEVPSMTAPRPQTSFTPADPVASLAGRARLALERRIARRLLASVPGAPFALRLPDGETIAHPGVRPRATLVFRDTAALLGMAGPDAEVHFGDRYADGRIEVEGELLDVLMPVFLAPKPNGPAAAAARLWKRARRRRNTLRGSRDHIHHHYDLGNDFYALWLDPQLVYTCAYFPTPDASLEAAQRAKLEHVARKLRVRPGERIVEAGCGWGALALHLARHHGARVRAFNISREQLEFARARARAEGLAGQVEFVEDDYRNVSQPCDAFVSVGMLEHV